MITGIDHVYLTVSDLDRSEDFYDTVMALLGFRKGDKPIGGERHAHYFNPALQITIRPARSAVPHDPYAPGLHHLCLQTGDRSGVDGIYGQLRDHGVAATTPALYPEYNPEYYATFFEDPDGLRFEVVARTAYRDEVATRWGDLDTFLNPLAELHARERHAFNIRPLASRDYAWVEETVTAQFASPRVVSRGVLHHVTDLPGLIAEGDDGPVGVLQYHLRRTSLEVVILISLIPGSGMGRRLLNAVQPIAQAAGCQRLWLITTNNNQRAMSFYESLGWRRVAVHRGAVAEARALKPEIPEVDGNGVPIVDEVEYALEVEAVT